MKVTIYWYVSKIKAFNILLLFVEEKEIPKNVNWIDIYDLDFDHGCRYY